MFLDHVLGNDLELLPLEDWARGGQSGKDVDIIYLKSVVLYWALAQNLEFSQWSLIH